jgi:hypothetical protein
MHGFMLATSFFQQTLKTIAYSHRLIYGKLFLDGDMHAHVQKRVGISHFRQVILVTIAVRIIEYDLIFRVQQDDLERHVFHAGKDFPLAVLAPGVEEKLPCLISGRIKHSRCQYSNGMVLQGFLLELTQIVNAAHSAFRLARLAHIASVQDQPMVGVMAKFLRDELQQL